jgi:hypothetical protein
VMCLCILRIACDVERNSTGGLKQRVSMRFYIVCKFFYAAQGLQDDGLHLGNIVITSNAEDELASAERAGGVGDDDGSEHIAIEENNQTVVVSAQIAVAGFDVQRRYGKRKTPINLPCAYPGGPILRFRSDHHKKHDAGTVAFRRHGEASSASGFGSQAECRHNLPHSFR